MGSLTERGVHLALVAHGQGWMSEQGLALVLAYYDNEGAASPLPPEQVLTRLGGLASEHLASLAGQTGGVQPFTHRLTLLGLLGEGGMGAVHKAYDRVLKRTVAVKLIRADRLDPDQAEKHLARFEREAHAMAKVRHPTCVGIFDVGLSPAGQPYLVMEYVRGRGLSALITAAGSSPLDVRRAVRWGKAVAEALQACHDAGVVHRDVKPGNVIIDEGDLPHLTDFGIALDADRQTRLTAELAAVGTLAYLPPEQAGGGTVDARSDVYALGATLYEALTGRVVFEAPLALAMLQKIVAELPVPPKDLRADLDSDLNGVLLKCLEKEPEDRYPSAQALALDLSRWLAGEPVLARPLTSAARARRTLWRHRQVVAPLIIVFAGSLAAVASTLR